ncbi:hypothetical protein G6F57_022960 [Rhizopus arrhizus]|nr:hypothetical protein G6F35_017698 [Rhizopus arrhizus]KAG1431068.1 hypothetical protein G6F57_022960 [Rhizopus arrhizus]
MLACAPPVSRSRRRMGGARQIRHRNDAGHRAQPIVPSLIDDESDVRLASMMGYVRHAAVFVARLERTPPILRKTARRTHHTRSGITPTQDFA